MVGALAAITPQQATALASVALTLKAYVTIFVQGYYGVKGGSRPPEDQLLFPDDGAQSFDGVAKWGGKGDDAKAKAAILNDKRWRRIVLNDVESLPLGLAVAWGASMTPHSPTAHVAMVLTFAISRILHTIFYAKGLQPWRAYAWLTAVGSVIGLSINGVIGAFSGGGGGKAKGN